MGHYGPDKQELGPFRQTEVCQGLKLQTHLNLYVSFDSNSILVNIQIEANILHDGLQNCFYLD